MVYVESTDMDRMTATARSEGKTLVEWAREKLVEGIADYREKGVRRAKAVPAVEGGTSADGGFEVFGEKGKAGACPHGIEKGWRCTLCGGVVK